MKNFLIGILGMFSFLAFCSMQNQPKKQMLVVADNEDQAKTLIDRWNGLGYECTSLDKLNSGEITMVFTR